MSRKTATSKKLKKNSDFNEHRLHFPPQTLPQRNYKFLSRLYSSLEFGTNRFIIASQRVKVLRKLGLSNTKYLRKIKVTSFTRTENILPLYLRSILIMRGDLRELELENFNWKKFYGIRALKSVWDVILAKFKRLRSLKGEFLIEDASKLRQIKRYKNLREISLRAEGDIVSYQKLHKVFRVKKILHKLHINFSRCSKIYDPPALAATIDSLQGLKDLSLYFDVDQRQTFHKASLESVVGLFANLVAPDLKRVQVTGHEIMNTCIQGTFCGKRALDFYDLTCKTINKAGKRKITQAAKSLGKDFEVQELDYLHTHISTNMVVDHIKWFNKIDSLKIYNRKNESSTIMEDAGNIIDVRNLGILCSEDSGIPKDTFKKFINVQELSLFIRYEANINTTLKSLLKLPDDSFKVLRLKLALIWVNLNSQEFDDLIEKLSEVPKLNYLDLEIKASYFGKARFQTLLRLETCKSLIGMTLSLPCYLKSIGERDILSYFRKAKKLRQFRLTDYSPELECDRAALLKTVGRATNLTMIQVE